MTTFEIRSYSHNGANWEWNGDSWDVESSTAAEALESSKSGDFSAYDFGESCCLRAFGPDGEEAAALEFIPNHGTVRNFVFFWQFAFLAAGGCGNDSLL